MGRWQDFKNAASSAKDAASSGAKAFRKRPVTQTAKGILTVHELGHDTYHATKSGIREGIMKSLERFDSHVHEDPHNPITSSLKRIGGNLFTGASYVIVLCVLLSGVVWLTYGGKQDNSWYSIAGKVMILLITGGIMLSTWGRLLHGDAGTYHAAGAFFQHHIKGKLYNKIGVGHMASSPGATSPDVPSDW